LNLTQEDWVEADANAVILDVRTEDECNDGIIANAINIDIHKGSVLFLKLKFRKSKTIMSIVVQGLEVLKPAK
jgi:rhodanese-related sulfurtransferase